MILRMADDTSPDLDDIDASLNAVEVALVRLENGTYFTDEITGKPLDEQLLISNPIARRS